MDDRVDAGQGGIEHPCVTHVAGQEFGAARRAPGLAIAMHVVPQRIHHPHVVAASHQLGEDVPADEPGSSGEQHPHPYLPSCRRPARRTNLLSSNRLARARRPSGAQ